MNTGDKVSILVLDAQTRLDSITRAAGEDPANVKRRLERVVRRTAQMVAWSWTPEFVSTMAELAKEAATLSRDANLEVRDRLKAMEVFASLSTHIVDRVIPPLQRIRVSSSQFSGDEAPVGSVTAGAVTEAIERIRNKPEDFQVRAIDADFSVVNRSGENGAEVDRAAG